MTGRFCQRVLAIDRIACREISLDTRKRNCAVMIAPGERPVSGNLPRNAQTLPNRCIQILCCELSGKFSRLLCIETFSGQRSVRRFPIDGNGKSLAKSHLRLSGKRRLHSLFFDGRLPIFQRQLFLRQIKIGIGIPDLIAGSQNIRIRHRPADIILQKSAAAIDFRFCDSPRAAQNPDIGRRSHLRYERRQRGERHRLRFQFPVIAILVRVDQFPRSLRAKCIPRYRRLNDAGSPPDGLPGNSIRRVRRPLRKRHGHLSVLQQHPSAESRGAFLFRKQQMLHIPRTVRRFSQIDFRLRKAHAPDRRCHAVIRPEGIQRARDCPAHRHLGRKKDTPPLRVSKFYIFQL